LNGSSTATKVTTTDIAATPDWSESLRLSAGAPLRILSQTFTHTAGENTATAAFRPPPQPELYFAPHRENKQLAQDAEVADILRHLIDRAQLESGGIRVSLNLKRLIAEPLDARDAANLSMSRFIPMEMQRRGVEIRLVIEGEAARATRPDPALLKAIARGRQWFKEIGL